MRSSPIIVIRCGSLWPATSLSGDLHKVYESHTTIRNQFSFKPPPAPPPRIKKSVKLAGIQLTFPLSRLVGGDGGASGMIGGGTC